ncbi:MAG TPA: Hsp20/alpha crystallin family protein [Paludibacteraceae bacterium]|jgi:HSP20 family protein|nr:Hsp20/alpha crystallin family protein [Paludibacteraceae bacterium]OPZ01424.1 MAG: Spore protein SP21 [Bacteroidetes bacterium ADurb.BinA395]MBP8967183.1 Hsp20/alpha crystallin family protein [Paludibacteraceae bacterium]HOR39340.1 Hsp20/alpha crystallin family protein [Paludibacteraceae bacterium]HQF10687.1 Hsp20/alpha crystallin family protein [Paludibacteraceae bacterium]
MATNRLTEQLPSNFDRYFDNEWEDYNWTDRELAANHTTLPAVNIKENGEAFEIDVAAPGYEKSDIKIEMNEDLLTVSSNKKLDEEKTEGEYTKREFSYQSFLRTFTLPKTVDAEKISAVYENGILKITIPKKEEAKVKPARTIDIQ